MNVGLVVVILIIAAGLGALVLVRKNGGGADDSDYTKFYNPQVGEFVEYTREIDNVTNAERITILSINGTDQIIREDYFDPTGIWLEGNNWSVPCNLTFANLADINHPWQWSEATITQVGTENLSTIWGGRTCIQYITIFSDDVLQRFWVHNGVMVKYVWINAFPSEAGTWVLTATNIPEVTHGHNPQTRGGGEGGYTIKVGDFVKYYVTHSGTGSLPDVEFWNQTVTYTVVAMNETNFTINVSANGPGYFYSPENWSEPWSKSWSENWPKEWAFGADVDIGDFETNYDLTRVYKENITTNWGPLSCDHYYPAYIYGGQRQFGYDAWVKDGILVKWVKTYLQTNPTERTTRMLIDTNIPAITNP